MTPDEGMKRLIFYCQPETGSFLDMLRPYRGVRVEVLDDVMAALRASASKVSVEILSRDLVSTLWAISHLGRSWALEPGGMLRRNQLISEADQDTLSAFLERFDDTVMLLLGSGPVEEAVANLGTRD
jgi:hypothetical protein